MPGQRTFRDSARRLAAGATDRCATLDSGRLEPPAIPVDAGRLAGRHEPHFCAAYGGRDFGKRTGRCQRDRRSLSQGPSARNLVQGAARRPGRLDRRDAGKPETGRRPGSLRLRRLDACQRARGISSPLRAAPGTKLVAVATRYRRRPADSGPYRPYASARSAAGELGRPQGFRHHTCHHGRYRRSLSRAPRQ